MTNNDFKKLLNEALEPIKTDLNGVKNDIAGVKSDLRKTEKGLKQEVNELRDIIEKRVLPPLIEIEVTVKAYKDAYVTNQDHIGRLDKRLKTVEDNLDIQPSENLSIPSYE